jgi:hypothetical protein
VPGLLTSLLVALTAAAHPTIKVDPHSVQAGSPVTVHGVVPGCRGPVTLISRAFRHTHDFAGLPAIYARVGKGGAYSVDARIPESRRQGTYTVTGRCGGGNLGVTAHLTVYHLPPCCKSGPVLPEGADFVARRVTPARARRPSAGGLV